MGASDFRQAAYGKTAREAFSAAYEEAAYEHGHGGYTGTIAEKDGFRLFALPALPDDMTVQDVIDAVQSYGFADEAEPLLYGRKTEYDFKKRGYVVLKEGKPIPANVRAVLPAMNKQYEDKWGAACCLEVPNSLREDGTRQYIFFGIASD